MWRTILLGKLGISILASLLIGGICVTQPWRDEYTLTQSTQWIGVGVFFLMLGVAQVLAVYLLFRKKQFSETE